MLYISVLLDHSSFWHSSEVLERW